MPRVSLSEIQSQSQQRIDSINKLLINKANVPETSSNAETSVEEEKDSLETSSLLRKLLRKNLKEYGSDKYILERYSDTKSPLYSVKSFEDLHLNQNLLNGIYDLGFDRPSRIQEIALPLLLSDPPQNLIAQSQSGTGKTAAFALTMLSRIDTQEVHPQALCLAPTFELALQIKDVIKDMGKFIQNLVVYHAKRGDDFKGIVLKCHIIVSTSGTVQKMIHLKAFDPSRLKIFVLDEADVMIEIPGFADTSIRIHNQLEKAQACQQLLFSATFSDKVMHFAKKMLPTANIIKLERSEIALNNIAQYFIKCNDFDEKIRALISIYGAGSFGQCIIFSDSKKRAARIVEIFAVKAIPSFVLDPHVYIKMKVGLLTSDLDVEQRAAVINRFREAKERVLIATNVLARGIDVEQVNLVINFDIPTKIGNNEVPDFETYIHRIGRCGRFGKKGVAVNIIGSRDFPLVEQINREFNVHIQELDINDPFQIEKLEIY